MEKMAEKMSYIQYLPLVDRIDYLAGFFYQVTRFMTVKIFVLLHFYEKTELYYSVVL